MCLERENKQTNKPNTSNLNETLCSKLIYAYLLDFPNKACLRVGRKVSIEKTHITSYIWEKKKIYFFSQEKTEVRETHYILQPIDL